MDYFPDESKFQDPTDWDSASYDDHPIDAIEPLFDDPTPYRTAAIACLRILAAVDSFVSRVRDTRLAWVVVASVIGLDSTAGLSQAQIGRQLGVSELSVRRATAKFTKLANLDLAGGLRPLGQVRSNGGPLSKKTAGAR